MTAELKRALVDLALEEMGSFFHRGDAERVVTRILARLSAGSPEVIEAMCLSTHGNYWASLPETARNVYRQRESAALAAGMKKVMEG